MSDTNHQAEALRIADALIPGQVSVILRHAAADELRRQHVEIETLKEHLQFVERWANHHGVKPSVTAKEALSVIQHYPPIKRITQSYADGVVPSTPNPFERQPLTDEQIGELDCVELEQECYEVFSIRQKSVLEFARAIEHAHKIGSKA